MHFSQGVGVFSASIGFGLESEDASRRCVLWLGNNELEELRTLGHTCEPASCLSCLEPDRTFGLMVPRLHIHLPRISVVAHATN